MYRHTLQIDLKFVMADIKNQYPWCNNDICLVSGVSGGRVGRLLLPPYTYTVSPLQTTYAGDINHFQCRRAIVAPRDDDVRASTSIRYIKTLPSHWRANS